MVAIWPTDNMNYCDKGFWLGDVVECNLFPETVTVVHWEVSDGDNDFLYLRGDSNDDVFTVEFNLILLHGFVLWNGFIKQSTVNVINKILCDEI